MCTPEVPGVTFPSRKLFCLNNTLLVILPLSPHGTDLTRGLDGDGETNRTAERGFKVSPFQGVSLRGVI